MYALEMLALVALGVCGCAVTRGRTVGGADTSFTLSIKPRTESNVSIHAPSVCSSGPMWWGGIGLSLHISSNQGDGGGSDQYLILEHSGRLCVFVGELEHLRRRVAAAATEVEEGQRVCQQHRLQSLAAGWAYIDFVISGWTGWVKMAPAERLTPSGTTDVMFNIHVAPQQGWFWGNSCSRYHAKRGALISLKGGETKKTLNLSSLEL